MMNAPTNGNGPRGKPTGAEVELRWPAKQEALSRNRNFERNENTVTAQVREATTIPTGSFNSSRPYATSWEAYHAKGWPVLILPAGAKTPPPMGFTGYNGIAASYADLYAWAEERGGGNIAIRMPRGVVGIDVDAYTKGGKLKTGDKTLARWLAESGTELPATWRITSRGTDNPSGKYLFRVPEDARLRTAEGDVELLQWFHRYAVAAPSRNGDDGGSVVRMYDPAGNEVTDLGEIPTPDELPVLPGALVEYLHQSGEAEQARRLEQGERSAFLASLNDGDPCKAMRSSLEFAIAALGSGSRHDEMLRAVGRILRVGEMGHRGVHEALRQAESAFVASVGAERRGGANEAAREFDRMVNGDRGVGLILARPTAPENKGCHCGTRVMMNEDGVLKIVGVYGDPLDADTIAMFRDEVPDELWERHLAPLFKEASITEPKRKPVPTSSKSSSKPKLTVVTDATPAALPSIVTKDRPMRDIRADMAAALRAAHQDDPKLFAHGTDVVIASGGRLTNLGPNSMAVQFSEAADFIVPSSGSSNERKKIRKSNAKKIEKGEEVDDMPELEWTHVDPPMVLVKAALETPGELGLPQVDRVMNVPFFGPDGTLQQDAGYHREARTIHIPAIAVNPVPAIPTKDEVDEALALIRTDLLGDFPFTSEAEFAGVLAMGLTIVARPMIDGPAPLFLVDAPKAGTGKGLLMEAVLRPLSGHGYTVTAAPTAVDEWWKVIVATLRTGPVAAIFDNVNSDLDSGPLASAVTAWPLIAPRVLQTSEIIELPPPCVFVATGNNVTASAENARRIVRIRLDAECEDPAGRSGWRHPDLRAWFTANTGRIVAAWLTLARSWIAAGMPQAEVPAMGSFETWSKVVGSILAHLGVKGFLTNRSGIAKAIDTESAARDLFVWGWINDPGGYAKSVPEHEDGINITGRTSCAGREVSAGDLLDMVTANGYDCPVDLGSGNQRGQAMKLGHWLRKLVDQRVGENGAYVVTSRLVRGQTVYGLKQS